MNRNSCKLTELERDFRYLLLTTVTVMQSHLPKYLVIKNRLLFTDLRKIALSLHWLLILYPLQVLAVLRLAVLGSEKMLPLKITIIFSNRPSFNCSCPAFLVSFLHQMKLKSCAELFTAQYSGVEHGVSSSSEAGRARRSWVLKLLLFLSVAH